MEKTFHFLPTGVCSRGIDIVYEGETIKKVTFTGGCPGNTLGVSRLVAGKSFQEVIDLLGDVKCGAKPTSCPMQLAHALEAIRKLA